MTDDRRAVLEDRKAEKPRRIETEPEGGDLWWAPVLRVPGFVSGAWGLIVATVRRRRA